MKKKLISKNCVDGLEYLATSALRGGRKLPCHNCLGFANETGENPIAAKVFHSYCAFHVLDPYRDACPYEETEAASGHNCYGDREDEQKEANR